MRIGLIGVSALGGEHYHNLLDAVCDGRIDEIVLADVKLSFEDCMAAPYRGRFKGRYFGLIGTKGMMDIDEQAGEVLALNDFIHRISSGITEPRFPSEDVGISTSLCQAIQESIERGGRTLETMPVTDGTGSCRAWRPA